MLCVLRKKNPPQITNSWIFCYFQLLAGSVSVPVAESSCTLISSDQTMLLQTLSFQRFFPLGIISRSSDGYNCSLSSPCVEGQHMPQMTAVLSQPEVLMSKDWSTHNKLVWSSKTRKWEVNQLNSTYFVSLPLESKWFCTTLLVATWDMQFILQPSREVQGVR